MIRLLISIKIHIIIGNSEKIKVKSTVLIKGYKNKIKVNTIENVRNKIKIKLHFICYIFVKSL